MRLLFLVVCTCSSALFSYDIPDWVQQKYQSVYHSQIVHQADGSTSFHHGRLFRRGGIRVLSLKGDDFEMAFQHGRLLQSEIASGALPETAALLEKSVKSILPEIPLLTSSVIDYFYRNYTEQILQNFIRNKGGDPDKVLLEAYGLSEGAQVSVDTLVRGVLGPESLKLFWESD